MNGQLYFVVRKGWQRLSVPLTCYNSRAISKDLQNTAIYWRQSRRETGARQKHNVANLHERQFPIDKIRNFGIIAHIDHGKSTLADRLMELTGAIASGSRDQYLDKLQVERERGITVKAQTVSMIFNYNKEEYLLNLIDTPGHVDFSYEVSRSLSACDGVILLVDAAQGVQAQTVANFYLAFEQELTIVPILNKCDQSNASPEAVAESLQETFDIPCEACLRISAKTGFGVKEVLPTIIRKITAPKGNVQGSLRLLLFDAYHDEYRGVICLVVVKDGVVKVHDKLTSLATSETMEVLELGILAPEPKALNTLTTGQVGYIITGMKSTKSAKIGDTWHLIRQPVKALPGFKQIKSMIYAGIYPLNSSEFDVLSASMERLVLNDASVSVIRESSTALGAGFRCGFLGMLHMEVFHQRLEDEYGALVLCTPPTVPYTLIFPDDTEKVISNPTEFPLNKKIKCVLEPTVKATIITPHDYIGNVMTLCQDSRGALLEHVMVGRGSAMLRYILPLAELGGPFYNNLKSTSSGYASFDYIEGEKRPADMIRLDLMLNGEVVDALARMVHRQNAQRIGRKMCQEMHRMLERRQYEIVIQSAANGSILARETIKAYRKNVLAKCYGDDSTSKQPNTFFFICSTLHDHHLCVGGDITRKRKLLEKQKEGKKRLSKMISGIEVPQEIFHSLIKSN